MKLIRRGREHRASLPIFEATRSEAAEMIQGALVGSAIRPRNAARIKEATGQDYLCWGISATEVDPGRGAGEIYCPVRTVPEMRTGHKFMRNFDQIMFIETGVARGIIKLIDEEGS